MQKCIKCDKPLPKDALFCCWCGKKQTATTKRNKKLANGSGSVWKMPGNRQAPWAAVLPAETDGNGKSKRQYLGYYRTRTEAVAALAKYVPKNRRGQDKINITFSEIYDEYTAAHFKKLSSSAINVIKASYKYFCPFV